MTERPIYYIYIHIDPETKEVLYVGMGKGARAYALQTTEVKNSIYYVHRSPEHSQHLNILLDDGYLPHEWIEFKYKHLPKEVAKKLERKLIQELKPLYNRKHGIKLLKFNREEILHMKELRDKGLFYSQIAEQMKCSPMVAHRIINNLSPRYKELLNE